MPLGLLVLFAIALLIYLGALHRVLDRMRLSDRGALAVLTAMVLGSFVNLTLVPGRVFVNVGGALIPVGIAVYLLSTADETRERVRGLVAIVASALFVFTAGRLLPSEPGQFALIDPSIAYGIGAGLIGYAVGRSRRASFAGGVGGVVLADMVVAAETAARGVPVLLRLGGAGVIDAIVIAGLIAVGLAEVIGETREKLAHSGRDDGDREGADR